jgi:DNA-binding winged helix-turn-helix (wHTH) protein/Tol biopolymer transport system component
VLDFPARSWGAIGMATQVNGHSRLQFGVFEADLATRELYKRGVPVHLQDKPFQILVLLLERPREVVTREELQTRLWPNGTFVDFGKGLNTAVKKLRDALGDSAETPVFIETLPRRGYRFIAPVVANGSEGIASSPSIPANNSQELRHALESPVPQRDVRSVPRDQLRPSLIVQKKFLFLALAALILAALGFVARKQLSHTSGFQLQNVQITPVTDNGKVRYMAISPDGQNVAYALQEGLDQSLWLRNPESGRETQLLAPDTVNFSGLEFSPDGHSIYFIRSEKSNPVFSYLCRMPASGGPVEQLIRDADSPVSFSPDGQQFVYTRGYPPRIITEVRIANADGTSDHLLAVMPGHQVYEAGPTWSPDSRAIAVPLHLIGGHSRFVLYAISLSDSKPVEIYSSLGAIGRPLWVRNGKEFLVTLEDMRSHRGQLWTVSYPRGEARRFTNDLSDYSSAIGLTRNARSLATIVTSTMSNLWAAPAGDLSHPYQITSGQPSLFQVNELQNGKLLALGGGVWTMNSDATQRRRLTDIHDPQWIESCGNHVIVLAAEDGHAVLRRMKLDGSSATAFASADEILSPACSPDDRYVYYLNLAHPDKVSRISVEGGSPVDVAYLLGDTPMGNLTVSPDGKFLAYPYQQYSPPLVALAIIPATGGAPVRTFTLPGFIGRLRYSPDGNALQYLMTRNGATNLWEQPLDRSKATQLTKFNSGQIFDFSWSHDHKRLFLTRGESTRDVVLIANLDSHN